MIKTGSKAVPSIYTFFLKLFPRLLLEGVAQLNPTLLLFLEDMKTNRAVTGLWHKYIVLKLAFHYKHGIS